MCLPVHTEDYNAETKLIIYYIYRIMPLPAELNSIEVLALSHNHIITSRDSFYPLCNTNIGAVGS